MSIKLSVLVNDKAITEYSHKGDTYVEGRPGSEYQIKISNTSYNRVKVIVSVDGLSVIDGKPASEDSEAYVVEGNSSITIPGWLTSLDTANKFKFGSKKKSYSNKVGYGTGDVGVIGVMAFRERTKYVGLGPVFWNYKNITWVDETQRRYDTTPNYYPNICSSSASGLTGSSHTHNVGSSHTHNVGAAYINNIGTEMGEDITFHTTNVDMEVESTPFHVGAIYYDDKRGLEARGIIIDRRKLKPSAFPASNRYCKKI